MEYNYKHNKALVPLAKTLRKNMTKEEKHLWYDFLKNYPVKVTRQKVIGNYIVDFYCASAKLVKMVLVSRNSNRSYCFDTKSPIWLQIFKENLTNPLQ